MIGAVLKLVPDFIKIPVAMLLGAAIAFYPASWYGASQERNKQEVKTLTESVQALRERNIVDAQVTSAPPATVCSFMGLRPEDVAECLRRLEAADANGLDGSNDNQDRSKVCGPGVGAQPVRGPTRVLEIGTK